MNADTDLPTTQLVGGPQDASTPRATGTTRLVIFTGHADLPASSWWEAISAVPDLGSVLVCRRRVSFDAADVRARFIRNVRKHGLLFVPYRALTFVGDRLKRLVRGSVQAKPSSASIPLTRIDTLDLHAVDTLEAVAAWGPDLGLALGGPILKPSLFTIPRMGTLNIHLGKVPDYRGAPPAFWEMDTGAREIGATVHWIDAGLDTGDIVLQRTAPIYPIDSLAEVEARVGELGRHVLTEALTRVIRNTAGRAPQPTGGRTFRIPLLKKRLATQARLGLRGLARSLAPRNVAKSLYFAAFLGLYRPLRDALRTLTGRHPVRVFTYHRVTRLCRDGMTISPEAFAQQLDYLARTHRVVPLSDALRSLRAGERRTRPLAAITFDDGYRSVLTEAWPLMRLRGMTGTCFLPTALIGTDARLEHDAANPVRDLLGLMDWEEVDRLVQDGWEMGSHTATHVRLSTVAAERVRLELSEPIDQLRRRYGLNDVVIAYPFGRVDDISEAAREQARALGYLACLGDYGGENFAWDDPLRLLRIEVGGDHAILGWKTRMHGLRGRPPKTAASPLT